MITKATLNDVPALNILVNSAYRGESSKKGWTTEADLLGGIRIDEERLAKLIDSVSSQILKYTDKHGDIIACVNLEKREHRLYLGMLTVSPELQGKGIGKELLKAAEMEATKQGCTSIYMSVITDRPELTDWYIRHGYVNTGVKNPFPMNDPKFGLPKKELEFVILEKVI